MLSRDGERECYPGTSRTRPQKLEIAGFGDYYCISCCKSTTLDKNKIKSGIGMFGFPSNQETRKNGYQLYRNTEGREEQLKEKTGGYK